jgi:hypothetical protein
MIVGVRQEGITDEIKIFCDLTVLRFLRVKSIICRKNGPTAVYGYNRP